MNFSIVTFAVVILFYTNFANASINHPQQKYRVVVMGDSLVAGYGLNVADSLPNQLQEWLVDHKVAVVIEAAGLSGDTSFGLLNRLPDIIKTHYDAAIVIIGGNDLLRAIAPDKTRTNITQIIAILKQQKMKVQLVKFEAHASYGSAYQNGFKRIYEEMEGRGVVLLPFILQYTLGNPSLMQADGIHPNIEGVKKIVAAIGPEVQRSLLER
jgi:acyl-CoA thioesterase-1